MSNPVSRRTFVAAGAAATAASAANTRLAAQGGVPVRREPFPGWPRITALEEQELLKVLRSGRWFRGGATETDRFEQQYARLLGSRYCVATANGTSALFTALNALGVGPGDEVILPPYTFVATVNVVLLQYALPVFVDTDPETFQIDATRIDAAVTDHTAVLMPVHIGGASADMDAIAEVSARRKLPVIEDACQAHLGEWRNRRVGSLGTAGCFSFQNSKNLPAGEGGAIVTNDEALARRCYAFHNNGRGRRDDGFAYQANGANLRMTEFQAALLMAQMTRLEEQSKRRDDNGAYLTRVLSDIPGIEPAKLYPGCTRNAWHLYMFRYRKEQFAGASRTQFLKALAAEGVPASGGYKPLNKEPFLEKVLLSKAYRRIYSDERLKRWRERNHCPVNDKLCEEAVWLTQNLLLGERRDMDQIGEAIRKIQANRDALRSL